MTPDVPVRVSVRRGFDGGYEKVSKKRVSSYVLHPYSDEADAPDNIYGVVVYIDGANKSYEAVIEEQALRDALADIDAHRASRAPAMDPSTRRRLFGQCGVMTCQSCYPQSNIAITAVGY